MNLFEPTASKCYQGFYEISGFSRYVISPEGVIIDQKLNVIRHYHRNPDGYYNYFLYKDSSERTTLGRHRVLCMVFKPMDCSYDDLVVNHKNGIKGDDRLDNLEWTTYQGNAEHAGKNGLTEKCVPISVRNTVTGIVMHFPSIIECARYYSMSKDAIGYRVKIGEKRIFPEKKQYREYSEEPWYIPNSIEHELKKNSTSKSILVRNVFDNTVKEYARITDFCEEENILPSTVSQWLSRKSQSILPGLLQIKWSSDETPWCQINDPLLEFNTSGYAKKIVKLICEKTGNIGYYHSASDCAKAMGISPTALDYRLKTQGSKVFSDNFRYGYYPYGPTDQKWSDGIFLN